MRHLSFTRSSAMSVLLNTIILFNFDIRLGVESFGASEEESDRCWDPEGELLSFDSEVCDFEPPTVAVRVCTLTLMISSSDSLALLRGICEDSQQRSEIGLEMGSAKKALFTSFNGVIDVEMWL